jgi:chromate transport protein ChrA
MIVLAFTWAYVRYGSTPQADALLYGITPVVVAIVAHALWGFLRQAVKGPFLALVLLVRIVQHRWEDRGRVASVTLLGTPLRLLTLLSAGSGPRR